MRATTGSNTACWVDSVQVCTVFASSVVGGSFDQPLGLDKVADRFHPGDTIPVDVVESTGDTVRVTVVVR